MVLDLPCVCTLCCISACKFSLFQKVFHFLLNGRFGKDCAIFKICVYLREYPGCSHSGSSHHNHIASRYFNHILGGFATDIFKLTLENVFKSTYENVFKLGFRNIFKLPFENIRANQRIVVTMRKSKAADASPCIRRFRHSSVRLSQLRKSCA